MAELRMRCPDCGKDVPVLPPREAGAGRRSAAPWRRKQHWVDGYQTRCRYPTRLTDAEVQLYRGVALIRQLAK